MHERQRHELGEAAGALLQLGIVDHDIPWLSSPRLAMWSVIAAHLWREFPLPAVLFLAGLQQIPADVYEAWDARESGAKFQQEWQDRFDASYFHDDIALLEALPVGVAVALDSEAREVTANSALAEMFGGAFGALRYACLFLTIAL